MSGEPRIRRTLQPGDLGAIVALHGRLYAAEYGVDVTFEAGVAGGLVTAVKHGWPDAGGGIWIVERDGACAGSVGLTDEGGGEARLRWFVLHPDVRGRGLGRRLLTEALARAAEAGHERVTLETFSELTAAARLYTGHGFRVVRSEPRRQWGREELVMQLYELVLAGDARHDAGCSPASASR